MSVYRYRMYFKQCLSDEKSIDYDNKYSDHQRRGRLVKKIRQRYGRVGKKRDDEILEGHFTHDKSAGDIQNTECEGYIYGDTGTIESMPLVDEGRVFITGKQHEIDQGHEQQKLVRTEGRFEEVSGLMLFVVQEYVNECHQENNSDVEESGYPKARENRHGDDQKTDTVQPLIEKTAQS